VDKIAIIGLGYVGLPLAHAFSEKHKVIGFDIALDRIDDLMKGLDKTLELSSAQVKPDNLEPARDGGAVAGGSRCNLYFDRRLRHSRFWCVDARMDGGWMF